MCISFAAAICILILYHQLEEARSTNVTHQDLMNALQSQIGTLEAEVVAAKEALEATKISQTSGSEAAADVEHEALLKARSDLAAIKTEVEALEKAHAEALEEAVTKAQEYEEKAAKSTSLEKQVADLLIEKEESANKVSELEVEILEIKDSQEGADDEKTSLRAKLSSIQAELKEATAATQKALDDAQAKDAEYSSQSGSTKELHEQSLQAAADAQSKLAEQIKELEEQLSQSQAANAKATEDAKTALEAHAAELAAAEESFQAKQTQLTTEISRISADLEVRLLHRCFEIYTHLCFRVNRASITQRSKP